MKTSKTEQEILQAATELFLEKGFAATSTTDIANRVGCNQALVHYYFRTKENLVRQVFMTNLEQILNLLDQPLPEGLDFFGIADYYIDIYYNYILGRPSAPLMIINEMLTNPERREMVREIFMKNLRRQLMYYNLDQALKQAIEKGLIRQIETLDLLIDIASLTLASFLIAPIYADLLQRDAEAQKEFILHRREETKMLIRLRLMPQKI